MADRVQKILARAGIASRRASEELIRAGRVTVNGKVAQLGDTADAVEDAIKVDGNRVVMPTAHRYLLLNKPKAYITSKNDPEGRSTVMELVPRPWRKGLVPVGRLDFNTEGLLLLTTDGEFAQHVSHPSHGCRKSYAVKVKGHPPREAIQRLRDGIVIDGKRTAPAWITKQHRGPRDARNSWWSVDLGEGRTRQIREMFFRVGHPVLKLKREAIGGLEDRRLPLGEVRELTQAEVEGLMSEGGGGRARKKARKSRKAGRPQKPKKPPKPRGTR